MTDRVQAYEDALRSIAAAVVEARNQTPIGSMRLSPGVGEKLLCDVESYLAGLIVLGAVPQPRRAVGGTCSCDGPPHPYAPGWCPPGGRQ